jgi:hypothetical protein
VQSRVRLIPQIGQYIPPSGANGCDQRCCDGGAAFRLLSRSILYAAVVEFIHTATLVHDDIIDDADFAATRQQCIHGGATTSPYCSAIISTSNRWRWR